MPLDVKVLGANELKRVAAQLKAADKTMIRELRRELDKAVEPVEKDIVSGLPAYMPDRYAAVLAPSMRFKTSTRTTGRDVSVRLVLTARGVRTERQIRTLNEPGILRSPIFAQGRRSTWRWKKQSVRRGFFTDPVEASKGQIRLGAVRAMHRTADKITKG